MPKSSMLSRHADLAQRAPAGRWPSARRPATVSVTSSVQPLGRQPAAAQGAARRRRASAVSPQVPAGDVDRDGRARRGPGPARLPVAPAAGWPRPAPSGRAGRPRSDSSATGMNASGGDQPVARPLPAHQRLVALDQAVPRSIDRLVVQRELARGQPAASPPRARRARRAPGAGPRRRPRAARGRRPWRGRSPTSASCEQAPASVARAPGRPRSRCWPRSSTCWSPSAARRRRDGGDQRGRPARPGRLALATGSTSTTNSSPPSRPTDVAGRGTAARIRSATTCRTWSPRGVPVRVVDRLEVVEVDEQQPDHVPVRVARCRAASTRASSPEPVGQLGQRVVRRLVDQVAACSWSRWPAEDRTSRRARCIRATTSRNSAVEPKTTGQADSGRRAAAAPPACPGPAARPSPWRPAAGR